MINRTKHSLFLFLLLIPAVPSMAQPDTIQVLLQQPPPWLAAIGKSATYRGRDSIFMTDGNSGIWFSNDAGLTFKLRDTTSGSMICIPPSKPWYQRFYDPLWQLDSSGAPELSSFDGLSWRLPLLRQNPGKGAVVADGVSFDGTLFWFSTSKNVILTRSLGNVSWDTLPFSAAPGTLAWYDAQNGAQIIGNASIRTTSDVGLTWDTLKLPGGVSGALYYPAPGVLFTTLGQNGHYNFVSNDTGHSWNVIENLYLNNLSILHDSLWYAMGIGNVIAPYGISNALYRSTDLGKSWNQINYTCPNGPTNVVFADSLHGVSIGTAQTNDGGFTWDCQDTTVYVGAPPYILPSDFDASSYYDLSYLHGTNYICLSTNRGDTWSPLFPDPQVGSLPWGTPIGRILFIAFPDKVIWTGDFGKSFDTLRFAYPGATAGYIHRTQDGTLWASNDLDLYISTDTGTSWINQSENVPYSKDSFQLTYTFTPVDSITGFVKTSSGQIFYTSNAGLSWQRQPDTARIPTQVIDSRHWISNGAYTSDAGLIWSWDQSHQISFAIDTLRWLSAGLYSSDGGTAWLPIPGWPQDYPKFTVVDSSTAFGGYGTLDGPLWRLDMPWYVKAQSGVAEQSSAIDSIAASPNPVSTGTIISFGISKEAYVKIEVFDLFGNRVSSAGFESLFEPGNKAVPISLVGLPSGTYFARIVTAYGEVQTVKLVKE